jgi:spore coat protein A
MKTKRPLRINRREFLKAGLLAGAGLLTPGFRGVRTISARATGGRTVTLGRVVAPQIPGGTLAPGDVDKFVLPLVKPPAMPLSSGSNKNKDKYKIAVRQFRQRILSPPHPVTKVWSYGSVGYPGTAVDPDTGALTGGTFNYPAFTIEATSNKTTQVQWRNELVDAMGNFLPHILPVDQTLHWANPPGGLANRDKRGFDPAPYMGPVPIPRPGTCPTPTISPRAMPRREPFSTITTQRMGTTGRPGRPRSSTPTTSRRRRCGTTITRWA